MTTIGRIARPPRKAPDAEARLAAFARDFAGRQEELENAGDELQAERDAEIRAAHADGLPEQAIARVLKISQQRVSQILSG